MQQQGSYCDYSGMDSWVVLSSIELSIKKKIESVGTPLKDWDINIYRGILTGYNEAFIISTEKRNAILENCQNEDERKRTAELIRPILRGRDIKRYDYDWANIFLISLFPARRYDIDRFPAVKNYLLTFAYDYLMENGNEWVAKEHLQEFCQQKLAQTGKEITIAGKLVLDKDGNKEKSRKKTSNKWFETQDSISFWEDFSKPKILWKRIGSILRFSYVESDVLGLDSTCIATGKQIPYLCCVLNSSMGHYLLKDAPKTGTGDLLISVQAMEPIRIPVCKNDAYFNDLLEKQVAGVTVEVEEIIDEDVFDLYHLTQEEREYVRHLVAA